MGPTRSLRATPRRLFSASRPRALRCSKAKEFSSRKSARLRFMLSIRSADSSARRELEFFFATASNAQRGTKQYTLALIKPDAVAAGNGEAIVNRIKYEGFAVIAQKRMTLSKERAEAFYAEHKGRGFFDELVAFMISGDLLALKLEREDAIKTWRRVMGPTNFETAKNEAPQSVRALYATSMTKNASHGSDSAQSAKRELGFFFAPN